MNSKILVALSLVAVALAGCTDEPAPGTATPTGATPTTSTPTPTPTAPATPTPAATPKPGNATGNNTAPPSVKQCPIPAPAPANATMRMGYPELVYTVKEPQGANDCFQFVGPETATAGWTAITLQNNGRAPHIMPLFRLPANKSLADVVAAFSAGQEPTWALPVGGVGIATPFSSGTVLVDLQPGTYLMACFIDGHHMQGMFRTLNVTAAPANATPAPAPTANLTIKMFDFAFEVPANVTAGTYVVAFVNNGTQPHEAPLIALTGNATMDQFLAAIKQPTGPPPGRGIGGVNMLAPNATAYAIVTFAPGSHGLVCFVTDHQSHKPHLALGMVTQFAVSA